MILESIQQSDYGGRLSFIITSRPVSDNQLLRLLEAKCMQTTIHLKRDDTTLISVDQEGVLVEKILQSLGFDHRSTAALANKLHQCGCGRPLHILATVKVLLSKSWVSKTANGYVLSRETDLEGVQICPEFLIMLENELENLDPKVSDILQCCATMGIEFRVSLVANILRMDTLELLDLLRVAEGRGIVRDMCDQDDVFCFREKRLCWYFRKKGSDASDPKALKQVVREYHKRYVQIVESELSEKGIAVEAAPFSHIAALAAHTDQIPSTWPEKTFFYNRLAGDMNRERGTLAEAIRYYDVAVSAAHEWKDKIDTTDQFSCCVSLLHCLIETEMSVMRREECIERLAKYVSLSGREVIDRNELETFWVLEILHHYRSHASSKAHEQAVALLNREQLLPQNRLRTRFYAALSMSRSDKESAAQCVERMSHR